MKIIVQNIAVEYRDDGEGDVILFLHGWGDSLKTFDTLFLKLKEENRVISIDLPGFGESEKPKNDWNLDDYVLFLNDFIKKIGVSVKVFIGHSFGGRILIKGFSTEKITAEKMILIAAAGIANRKNLKNTLIKILTKTMKMFFFFLPFRKKIRRKFYKIIGSDYLDAKEMRGTFLKIITENLIEDVKKIDVPVLLIWGRNDKQTLLKEGKIMNQLISRSELKVVKDAGHFVHKEKEEEVLKLVKNFL
jgi:pimeloyl-ACP methyl ester carboxylesterase